MLLRLSPFGVVGHGISALGFCSLIEQPLLTEWVSVALILRWTHSIQNELVWFHHIRSRWIILDHSTRMRYFDWINILCLKIGTGLWTKPYWVVQGSICIPGNFRIPLLRSCECCERFWHPAPSGDSTDFSRWKWQLEGHGTCHPIWQQ